MSPGAMPDRWERLNRADPAALVEARLQSHWAAQAVAAAARAWAPAKSDDSHTALAWIPEQRLLAGTTTGAGLCAALRCADLTLLVLDEAQEVRADLALAGHTLDDAFAWVATTLGALEGRRCPALERPQYDMPDHPVAMGRAFRPADTPAHDELCRWYSDAWQLGRIVAASEPGASLVRCWPHHFDLATLISLDGDEGDPEAARSIGVGMSPGDGSYSEPYFYVTPWPALGATDLALDGAGRWHTRGWVGAVLPASALESATAREQAEQVAAFVRSALAAGHELLDRDRGRD